MTCCSPFLLLANRTAPCQLEVIDFGNNSIPDGDEKVYELLAHLPLAHPSIISIKLGGALQALFPPLSRQLTFMLEFGAMHVITYCRQSDFVRLGGDFVQCEQGPCQSSDPWLVREDFPPVSQTKSLAMLCRP